MQTESIFKVSICTIMHKFVWKWRCLGRINQVRNWIMLVRKKMMTKVTVLNKYSALKDKPRCRLFTHLFTNTAYSLFGLFEHPFSPFRPHILYRPVWEPQWLKRKKRQYMCCDLWLSHICLNSVFLYTFIIGFPSKCCSSLLLVSLQDDRIGVPWDSTLIIHRSPFVIWGFGKTFSRYRSRLYPSGLRDIELASFFLNLLGACVMCLENQ